MILVFPAIRRGRRARLLFRVFLFLGLLIRPRSSCLWFHNWPDKPSTGHERWLMRPQDVK